MATTPVICETCHNQLQPGLVCSCNRRAAAGGNSDASGTIIRTHVFVGSRATVYRGVPPHHLAIGHDVSPFYTAESDAIGVVGMDDRPAGVDEPIVHPMSLDVGLGPDQYYRYRFPLATGFNETASTHLDHANIPTIHGLTLESVLHALPFAAPLRRTEIDEIPTVSVTSEDVDNQSSCVICCELFILGTVITKLTCNHLFHTNCIGEWLKRSGNCPICRRLFSQPNEARSPHWLPPADI